jgi:hypothetical protein
LTLTLDKTKKDWKNTKLVVVWDGVHIIICVSHFY